MTSKARRPHKDTYQAVTDRIITALEQGTVPWERSWKTLGGHRNACTGRLYNGINTMLLELAMMFGDGYDLPLWLTYGKARELGLRKAEKEKSDTWYGVQKHEKGVPIIFWKPCVGRARQGDDGEGSGTRTYLVCREYSVFNLAQTGLGLQDLPKRVQERSALRAEEPVGSEATNMLEELLAESGIEVQHGGNQAAYSPSLDRIKMPKVRAFDDREAYVAILAHEHAHATGHKSRLDRQLNNRFGDMAYAAEELIAEMASAFLCAQCKIDGQLQHESYLDHWLKILRGDNRAIFTAASKAKQAAAWLNEQAGVEAETYDEVEAAA